MKAPNRRRAHPPVAARRRREIRQQLARHGLLSARRDLPWAPVEDTPFSARLRSALEELGFVGAAFGRYLATRVDLLPPQDCRELARTRLAVKPAPPAAVRDLLSHELGNAAEEVLPTLEAEPRQLSWIHQWHGVTLPNGEQATIKLVRPGLRERLAEESDPLHLLSEVVSPWGDGTLPIEDFEAALRRLRELAPEAVALEQLASALEGFELPVVAGVHRHLSSQQVLTTRDLGGWSVGERRSDEVTDADAAYRIALTWLLLSLVGRWTAPGPLAESLVLLPEGRVGITGGPFAAIGDHACRNLFEYLAAARRHDVDRAYELLLRELVTVRGAVDRESLRGVFRQAMPMREGDWSGPDTGRRLADHVFLQGRLARGRGYRPTPHLVAFYRGLAELDLLARRLDPEGDALREALNDARWVASAVELRENLHPARIVGSLTHAIPRLAEVLDTSPASVSTARDERAAARAQGKRRGAEDRDKDAWIVFAGLLLLLFSVALVADRLRFAFGGLPIEEMASVVCGAILAVLLGYVMHRGGE